MPVGIANIGNTCFLNAALQCIMALPRLCEQLRLKLMIRTLPLAPARGGGVGVMLRSVCGLLEQQAAREEDHRALDASAIKAALAPIFPGSRQQDAHEALTRLIEALHSDCGRRAREINEVNEVNEVNDDLAVRWWRQSEARDSSIVSDELRGQLESEVACVACGHLSRSFEAFWELLVSPSGHSRLEACVGAFFAREHLGHDYRCDGCGRRGTCARRMSVRRAPAVLVVCLKRFCGSSMRKLEDAVLLPERTSLGGRSYALRAVVDHVGSLSGGHYTTRRRDHERWVRCNDSHVAPCASPCEVPEASAYILVYAAVDVIIH